MEVQLKLKRLICTWLQTSIQIPTHLYRLVRGCQLCYTGTCMVLPHAPVTNQSSCASQFLLQGAAVWHRLTISLAIYATFFKRHDVLCKCSCLVREDVVDLPQLLIQRGGSGLRSRVLLRVIHLQVPVYKIALAQTNHFNTKQNKINVLTSSCTSYFKIMTYYQIQGTLTIFWDSNCSDSPGA